MLLSQALDKDAMLLAVETDDQKELLDQMIDLLFKGNTKNKKEFQKAILEREMLGSTGIGNGVAIPHAKTKLVKDIQIAVAKVPNGIDFNALDGEPVYLVFLIAAPIDQVGGYLKVLAELAKFVRDKSFNNSLMSVKTPAALIKLIKGAEKNW